MERNEGRKRLMVIDGNAIVHRAFHALPPLTTKKGEKVNALYGFLLVLFRAIKDVQPDFIVACFDLPGPTFRHQEFADYKAQRPRTPDELKEQLPKVKEVLAAFSIPVLEKQGFEADDLIATISRKTERGGRVETIIITGDLDILQLVDKNTKVLALKRGITDAVLYDEERVKERYNLSPGLLTDFKALMGDPSDNIPGVPGVGPKTASLLIQKFGSLEGVYQALEKERAEISQRTGEALEKSKDQVFLAKTLVQAKSDVGIDFDLAECAFERYNRKEAQEALEKFEFYSLIKRLPRSDSKENIETSKTKKLLPLH